MIINWLIVLGATNLEGTGFAKSTSG